jgi:hypothetical protein
LKKGLEIRGYKAIERTLEEEEEGAALRGSILEPN